MKLKNKYVFNLQFFAEDENDENDEQGKEKTFTQDELDAIITKRLGKEKSKWQKEYEKKLEDEKAEAARLANLDATQRAEEEAKKREKALQEREAKIKQAEDKIKCEKVLKEKGLNTSFSQFLIGADTEITSANIDIFEKAFKEAVKAEVDTRIKGKTPESTGNETKDGAVSKEDFKRLSLFEQNKLYKANPEIYKSYYGAQ